MTTTKLDWNLCLRQQLDWHWREQLRPRLDGLTDAEYHWEPVSDAWGLRRRGTPGAPIQAGNGEWVIDFALPEPEPVPVTTIAWRVGHLLVGVFGTRQAAHFGGPEVDYESYDYPGTADEALARLDAAVAGWDEGVRSLGEQGLANPCGPAEERWAEAPLAVLVLHVNREALHHLAEVALLRDLHLRGG